MNYEDLLDTTPAAGSGDPRGASSPGRDTTAYRVRGERVPSVTEVISLAGMSDIHRIKAVAGDDVVANAARRGQDVHTCCELVDRDPETPLSMIPEAYRGYVMAWQAYKRDVGFEVIYIEEPVVAEAYGFAGTVDRICLDPDGAVMLLDLKTPAVPAITWGIQVAGYSIAAEASGLTSINFRACVRLRANGTYKVDACHGRSYDELFLAALRVAHFRLEHGLASLED